MLLIIIAIPIILFFIGKYFDNIWLMAPLGSLIFGYIYPIIGGLVGYFAFDTFWGGVGIGYLIAIVNFSRNPEKMINEHEESRESYRRTQERIREKERRRPKQEEERYLQNENGQKIEGYFYDDDTYKSGGRTYKKDSDGNWYEK